MAVRGPSALRPVVMALHWSTLIVIVAWLAAGLPGWALASHAALWASITVIWGMRGRPSPALPPTTRRLAWLSHGALLALYVAGAACALFDPALARRLLIATLGIGALHGVFNLWRSSVLRDGCLRRMTPRALH